MLFVLTHSAFALTCDPLDTLCLDVDTMQADANNRFNGTPVTDAVANVFLNRLTAADDALTAAGCIRAGYVGGKASGRRGDLQGISNLGEASGSLVSANFTGTLNDGDNPFGDSFDSVSFRSKQAVANIGQDGIAAGSFMRVSGRVAVFMGITATCGVEHPSDAIASWYGGNLDGWYDGGPTGFVFRDDPEGAYDRVDRMGMPAVNTALIAAGNKDAYNQAGPADDEALVFAGDILGSLDFLHAALDDDLTALGLDPCTVDGTPAGECAQQGVPLIIPDTLSLDPLQPAGFPNGRLPSDPVIDATLAVLLLDLDTHPVTTFAQLPLNPPANDAAFVQAFPFVAPPHE